METLAKAKEQIGIGFYPPSDAETALNVAKMIAEVYMLPDNCEIQIDGDKLPAKTVKEVYSFLTSAHVTDVIRRFKEIPYEIRRVKTYIRTALYNSVFEFELRLDNEVRTDNQF